MKRLAILLVSSGLAVVGGLGLSNAEAYPVPLPPTTTTTIPATTTTQPSTTTTTTPSPTTTNRRPQLPVTGGNAGRSSDIALGVSLLGAGILLVTAFLRRRLRPVR